MLVEGGYLHSMKQLLEKADADLELPRPTKGPKSFILRMTKRTPFSVLAPFKRIGVTLLRGSSRR
jgi:hypothetical protein